MKCLTNVDVITDALFERFVARSDVFAVQSPKGGYLKVEQPLTREILREHLEGKRTVGVYQLDLNSRVKWICLDLDPEKLSDPGETARRLLGACLERVKVKVEVIEDGKRRLEEVERPRVWEHSILLEASRYPDPSYHIWILFLLPVPAKLARWIGFRLLEKAGLTPKQVEVFPKQDALDMLQYGNLVKLPLGLHQVERKWSCFLDPMRFEPLPNEVLLNKVGLTFPDSDIEWILRRQSWGSIQVRLGGEAPQPLYAGQPLTEEEKMFCVNFLYKVWVPGYRNQVEMAFLGWCIKNGVPYMDARQIIEEVVRRKNDEEASERLRLVDYHYSSRIHLGRRLKGISGLKEAVMEALMK